MQPFSVRCHQPGAAAPAAAFFILSKGDHAGRPSYQPNPNCFAFTCPPEEVESYFWLVYALWECGKFRQLLRGSVIPFLLIGHVRECIEEGATNAARLIEAKDHLQNLQKLETNLKKQLALLREARRAIVRQALARNAA